MILSSFISVSFVRSSGEASIALSRAFSSRSSLRIRSSFSSIVNSAVLAFSSVIVSPPSPYQSFRPSFLRRLLYTRLLRPGLWPLRCFASVEQRLDLLIRTCLRRDQRLDLRRVLDLRRLYPAKLLVVGFHTLSHSITPSPRPRASAMERGLLPPRRAPALRRFYLRVYEGVGPAFRVNVRLTLAVEPILVKLEHLDKLSVRRRHLAEGLLEPL